MRTDGIGEILQKSIQDEFQESIKGFYEVQRRKIHQEIDRMVDEKIEASRREGQRLCLEVLNEVNSNQFEVRLYVRPRLG